MKKQVTPIKISTVPEYDPEKVVHSLVYIAQKLGGVVDTYKALKIVFFADKRHLERYGRLIFGDTYIAMDHGPVPSGAYDVVKYVRGTAVWCKPHPLAKKALQAKGMNIIPLIEADLDVFSDSDLMCLDEAIEECRHLAFKELRKKSHEDPAFKKSNTNSEITIEAIAGTLSNGAAILEYVHGQSE
jgi:uncharacterized phage-associated protein